MKIKDKYFPVLDHGFVSLVDYMGDDEAIERAARVSYGKGTRSKSKTRGLLRYLMRHRHTSPFEQVEFTFHCAMPMFVARQWVRHRTASLNEYSGRYSEMPTTFYTPDPSRLRTQKQTNKQGSSEELVDSAEDFSNYMRFSASGAFVEYNNLLYTGMAREVARINLPLSAYTQWYWKMDLHNLMHFLSLRADPHSQWEIRQYANIIGSIIKEIVPLAMEAWEDYVLNSVTLTYPEIVDMFRITSERVCDISDREKKELSEKREFMLEGKPRRFSPISELEHISPEEAEIRFFGETQ